MGLVRTPFELTAPERSWGRTIRGRAESLDPRRPRPWVMLVHGHRAFMDWAFLPELARRLAGAGLCAVSFNLSGSGVGPGLRDFDEPESFARNTYTRELEDLALVRDALEESRIPGADPSRGALFGHSRGGGMALLHAAERPGPRALCLWSPMHRVALFGPESLRGFEERGHIRSPIGAGRSLRLDRDVIDDARANAERLDVRAACGRIAAPTRVVFGEREPLLREGAADLSGWFARGVAEVFAVAGGDHLLGARHPLTAIPEPLERGFDLTVEWLRTHLEPGT